MLMQITTRSLFLSAVALASLNSMACAAPNKAADPQKNFSKKDTNSDGFLTLDEYKTGLKDKQLKNADKKFKKSDTSGDGKLTFDEFKAGMPKPKE
jgi:Ca2+-binding EF-hand superfamily protein